MKIKTEQEQLSRKLKKLEKDKSSPIATEDEARALAQRLIVEGTCNRELLVSLSERIDSARAEGCL